MTETLFMKCMRIVRVFNWVAFLPISLILISFSGIGIYWLGEGRSWWLALVIATLLLPLPFAIAFWQVRLTSKPRVAAALLIGAWITLEIYTLLMKGLPLPWHENVIRFGIAAAIISGAVRGMRSTSDGK
jgi:hypothetical protein